MNIDNVVFWAKFKFLDRLDVFVLCCTFSGISVHLFSANMPSVNTPNVIFYPLINEHYTIKLN